MDYRTSRILTHTGKLINIADPNPAQHNYDFDTIIIINDRDSIIYRLHYIDTVFTAEVDCPDCKDSVIMVKEPYPEPVYIKPTLKQKLMAGAGILTAIIAIIGLIKIAISIFRLV